MRLFELIKISTLVVPMLISLLSGPTNADLLTTYGKHRVEVDERADYSSVRGFRSAVSQKNLLGLSRKSPLSLPDRALSAHDAVNLRVCAIRVEFKYEDPDDPLTTGRGHFDMRSQAEFQQLEGHSIDMSPHNRSYFEAHLRALNEYWRVVSQDKVNLIYDVFPTQQDSFYTLDSTMGYYADTTIHRTIVKGLEVFFMESFRTADEDTAIHFADYDAFMVFHAGVDQQNDLGYPPTPHDLYTGFIFLGPELWVDLDDIPVLIGEGVMMPETASQDNRIIALNGVFAHEFGHQLGLVDLYDTRTWMTQIGDFSLHDNQGRGTVVDFGSGRYVLDVLPVFPDAWSRAYLGFAEVHEVSNARDLEVWAAELKTDKPQILKVPISDHEYFLIENRQIDSDRDDSSNVRADSVTGVILGPAPADTTLDKRYLTREYDYLLPGSGILIWHVDETRAYLDYTGDGISNFKRNTLQWYNYYPCLIPNNLGLCIDSVKWENRRFISVVEADGVIDFGGNYRTGFGTQGDFFYDGNNRAFGPTTNPSSRSNSGAYTGIWIYDISGIDTVMTVTVETESRVDGFPKFVNNSEFPPVLADIDGDGSEEIFISGTKHLIAMHADGSPVISPLPGNEVLDSTFLLYSETVRGGLGSVIAPDGSVIKGGSYKVDTLRSIASMEDGDTITTPPLVCDMNNDGVFEIAVGGNRGHIRVWEIADEDQDGAADHLLGYRLENVGSMCTAPAWMNWGQDGPYIVVGSEMGLVLVEALELGDVSRRFVGKTSSIAVDDSSNTVYLVAGPNEGRPSTVLMNFNGPILHDFGDADVVGFTAADLDNENGTDFAVITADGRLTILLSESPDRESYSVDEIHVADSLAGGVVTAALDRTVPYYQIIFAGDNLIHVYNHNGTLFQNFPQQVDIHRPAGLLRATPIVADADSNGSPDIIIGTDAGEVFAFGTDGVMLRQFPRFVGSGSCLSYALSEGSSINNFAGKLFALSSDNRLYALNVGSQPLPAEESWRQYGRSAAHRNLRGSSTTSVQPPSAGLITDFYNYPNPAAEQTTIRFRLRSEGNVKIQIYDLSGRLIYENRDVGGESHNDHVWNLDGYPSGVYICRLEASSGGSSEVQTHKIAVIK
jgi:M6 family metalloprotease-like protein